MKNYKEINIRYREKNIMIVDGEQHWPKAITVDGVLYTEENMKNLRGYTWESTANGVVQYFANEEGQIVKIPKGRFMNLFQDELREAIHATGLSMREVAEKMSIPYRTMQDWRCGAREPNKFTQESVLEKIAEINK